MRQIRFAALAVLALAGCASESSAPPAAAPAALNAADLQKLALHKVGDISQVIGAPSSQEKTATGVLWQWNTAAMDTAYIPTPVQTSGFISSLPKGADSTGGGGQTVERELKCRVRVTAGNDGYIQHLDFNGSRTACDPVTRRLADWIGKVG